MSDIYSPNVQVDNPVTVAGGVIDASGSSVSVTNFPATQPVSGSVSVSNFPATQPVSVAGTVNVITAVASSSAVTQLTTTGANQTLLAANPNRKSAVIFVASANCFVKFGAAASAASFTYSVTAANTTIIVTGWAGQIDAMQTTSGKLITITELV